MTIYEKVINDAIDTTKSVLDVIREKRGGTFKITDCKPYVDTINAMKVYEGQSEDVFNLHIESVNAHYNILCDMTETIRSEDEPFIEHYQTPVVLEILYDEDRGFKTSVDKFVDAIAKNKALIGREAARRYSGMYGPTCVVDFAMSCGSTANIINRVLVDLDIPNEDKITILSSKSWGMNTSYGFGGAFRATLERGGTSAEAEHEEVRQMQFIYRKPVSAQNQLMATHNLGGHGPFTSFDSAKYMAKYKKAIKPYVLSALDNNVHKANIVSIPAYCVGEIGHHIAQSAYNMFKDDMTFAIYESVIACLENTLRRGLEQDAYKNIHDIITVATGASACAAAYILWLDSFTVPMIVDLLIKRFYNYATMNPNRGEVDELHNVDTIDILMRGERILDTKPIGNGGEIKGIKVDLDPINNHEVIMNPQRYTYPACAITQRFAAMMSIADFPCYLTPEVVTATLMTNYIAINPSIPTSPARGCKQCSTTMFIKRNVPYVKGIGGGRNGYCQRDRIM